MLDAQTNILILVFFLFDGLLRGFGSFLCFIIFHWCSAIVLVLCSVSTGCSNFRLLWFFTGTLLRGIILHGSNISTFSSHLWFLLILNFDTLPHLLIFGLAVFLRVVIVVMLAALSLSL